MPPLPEVPPSPTAPLLPCSFLEITHSAALGGSLWSSSHPGAGACLRWPITYVCTCTHTSFPAVFLPHTRRRPLLRGGLLERTHQV